MIKNLKTKKYENIINIIIPKETLNNFNNIKNIYVFILFNKIYTTNINNNNNKSLFNLNYTIDESIIDNLIKSININIIDNKNIDTSITIENSELQFLLKKNNLSLLNNSNKSSNNLSFFIPIFLINNINSLKNINENNDIHLNIQINELFKQYIIVESNNYVINDKYNFTCNSFIINENLLNNTSISNTKFTLPCRNNNESIVNINIDNHFDYFGIITENNIHDLYYDIYLNDDIDLLNIQKYLKNIIDYKNDINTIIVPNIYNNEKYKLIFYLNNLRINKIFIDFDIIFNNYDNLFIKFKKNSKIDISVGNEYFDSLEKKMIDDVCPISHFDFFKNEVVIGCNVCKKYFKRNYILKWLKNKETCPWCCKNMEIIYYILY